MKNATFSHHVRPFPMLLAGAIVSPLVFLASCGSTPDQPVPKPEQLVQVEPAPLEAEPEPLELALTAEPTEAEQAEEKVDLQVAGMRAALQDALRASGIDPETLEVEGAEAPAEEPVVAALEPELTEPAEETVAEVTMAEATTAEEPSEVAAAEPEGQALPQAEAVLEAAPEVAVVEAAPSETPDAVTADETVAQAEVEPAPEPEAVAVAEEVELSEEVVAEDVATELALETPDPQPEVAALTEAELAKIEAELMLLGMDPGRTAPVDFDDFYEAPVEVAAEVAEDPDAAEELLAQAESVELVLDEELAMTDEPAEALAIDADPLVVIDATGEAADLAAPLLADNAQPDSTGTLADQALVADLNTFDALAQLLSEEAPQAAGAPKNVESLDQDALVMDSQPLAEETPEADPFAKFGAIQWEVTRIQIPAEVIAAQAEASALQADANGAEALEIQKVPVPSVATAVGNDWGGFQFMRSVPVEQRLLLAPLLAIDPSGGLVGISLAFQGISVSTNQVIEGAPQDPALAGLTYSDGAQFDPVVVESTAKVVNEPGIGMIWWSTEVPTTQVHAASEVQTPSVGRVRIVLNSGDYVEGTMHSAGLGQYKIDGELGRFAVRANLISHIERLPKPGLGQQVKGLQAGDLVRAKVKTGYIEGRLISMKDGKALVETATGMRISLSDAEVEPMGQSKTRVVID